MVVVFGTLCITATYYVTTLSRNRGLLWVRCV